MPRYTPDGKRIVNRMPRFEVPAGLLADIDGQAAKVTRLRTERDGSQSRIRGLERDAQQAGFAADVTTVRGLRKILNDHAVQLRQQAGHARVRLARAERSLADHMTTLRGLHAEARTWQRGEYEED